MMMKSQKGKLVRDESASFPRKSKEVNRMGAKNGKIDSRWSLFENSVYPATVLFFIGSRQDMLDSVEGVLMALPCCKSKKSAGDTAERFRALFGSNSLSVDGESLSVQREDGSKIWVVRIDSFVGAVGDVTLLSHECLHTALSLMGYFGVEENPPFEGLCYLHEAIFHQFLKKSCGDCGILSRTPHDSGWGSKDVGEKAGERV